MSERIQRQLFGTSFTYFFMVSLLFLSTSTIFAYKMPIGIPNPGFGLEDQKPLRPTNWDMEKPGYYYISYETGVESQTYGTPANPKKLLPDPIPAGSYVEINGNYSYIRAGVITVHAQGNAKSWVANSSGPVWVVGANSQNKPKFTSQTLIYGQYLYLDGISTDSLAYTQIGSKSVDRGADHILIRNCEFKGDGVSGRSGLSMIGTYNAPIRNIIIFKSKVYNFGDIYSSADQDACGIVVDIHCSKIWVISDTVYNVSGAGIRIGGAYSQDNPDSCNSIFVGNCLTYKVRQAGMAVKYAADIIFSQNEVRDIINTSWSPSKCIGAQYAPKRFWILNNVVHNARFGIAISSTNGTGGPWDIYAIGNVIYNIDTISGVAPRAGSWGDAAIQMQGGTNRYIIGNTIDNCYAGINLSGSGNYVIENNIIGTNSLQNHIFVENASTSTILRNCLLYRTDKATPMIKWGTKEYPWGTFELSTGQCNNCLSGDPSFTNGAGADYRINSGSAAFDKALSAKSLTSNVYQIFKDLYGIDIEYSADGYHRPINNWDVGAFEFFGIKGNVPPAKQLELIKK